MQSSYDRPSAYIQQFSQSVMSDNNFLKIYLRLTNGTGEKVSVNPLLTSKMLYNWVTQIFSLPEKSFDLVVRGMRIIDTCEITLQDLSVESDSIVHIQNKKHEGTVVAPHCIELRVFCQGSIYSYSTSADSTFQHLKEEMVSRLGCNARDITIVYLGKIMNNHQTLAQNCLKSRDLISVIIVPSRIGNRSSARLKPKMAESLTFAASDQVQNHLVFRNPREVLRKSSMKSSQESREFAICEQKKKLQIIRPKSSLTKSNNSIDPIKQEAEEEPRELLSLNKLWLSSQRMVETESINLDDSSEQQPEDDPHYWTECQVELTNPEGTMFYTIQCSEQHQLEDLLRVLKKAQRKQGIEVALADEDSQEMANQGSTIIDIARKNNTKIIHLAVFRPVSS